MLLNESQKIDFIKKAAFIADESSCNYKIGCVGVTDFALSGMTIEYLSKIQKIDHQIKKKGELIYLKTWNETLKGESYCQNCDANGKKICVREVESLKGRDLQKVCSIHAEQNLIAKCAKYGIRTEGMILFVTNSPCYICAKSIVQAGIKEVYYLAEHTDTSGTEFLRINGCCVYCLDFI